jgi:uncharacterized protein (UPF0335 family)
MGDAKLKSFVDRIETIETEQREVGKGKREVYDEAKDAGYNTKALRRLISERRMKDRDEITEAMDGYRVALGMAAAAVRDGMSLDDASEEYGFSRSAIHREASHCEEKAASGTVCEMTADDLGTAEPVREMVADDLGDPLLLVDKPRAEFKARVRAIAASVKVAPSPVGPVLTDAPPAEIPNLPAFLDRRVSA